MDSFLIFWILIILLIIGLTIGIIYLGYWIPKRFGKRKLGKWIAGILSIAVLSFIFSVVFEDELFFKSDAEKLLAEHNIELKENFKLNSNEFAGIKDFYHRFELTISESDKSRIKDKITSAENYHQLENETTDIRIDKQRYAENGDGQEFTANYQTESEYIYEYYKPNKKGYAPTYNRISIMKTENKLIYENISD
jgi:hypothetical protein